MSQDINKWTGTARLVKDAELSYTQGGHCICKFSIAVNARKKHGDEWVYEVSFFDCTGWGARYEKLSQYLTKGKQVAIEGRLRQNRWQAQDGSNRSKVGIEVENIVLTGASDGANRVSGQSSQPRQFDDDVPF